MTRHPRPLHCSRNPHRLYRDRRHGMLFGVCAGIADYFDWDVWIVRLAAVIALMFFFPFVLVAYLIAALALRHKPEKLYRDAGDEAFWRSVSSRPDQTLSSLKQKFRELEQRLARMETQVTDEEFDLKRQFRDL